MITWKTFPEIGQVNAQVEDTELTWQLKGHSGGGGIYRLQDDSLAEGMLFKNPSET